MRLRRIAALAGAAAGACALAAGPAFGTAAPPESAVAWVEEVAYEQPMSTSRTPLGPRVLVAWVRHAPGPTAASRPAKGRRPVARPTRSLQGSGCKTVWAARIGKSIFGFTIWRYTQEKYFCWSYPRLTSVQTNAYPCCTDPTWFWKGNVGSAGWFFAWAGSSRGGHYSFRQGRFEQRVLGRVIDSAQPWVKLWTYGNGGWSYATGS